MCQIWPEDPRLAVALGPPLVLEPGHGTVLLNLEKWGRYISKFGAKKELQFYVTVLKMELIT